MHAYRRTRLAVILSILGYAATALVLGLGYHHREVFPLFSWSLFTHVPSVRTDAGVQILQLGDRAFDPPLELLEARGLFPRASSIQAYYTVQKLAGASMARDGAEIERLRRLFESEYLGARDRHLRYRLILRRFDPIDRWRGGGYESRPLVEFEHRGEAP